MKTRIALTAFTLLALSITAFGDDMSDLQARFKARYPQISALKQSGLIGETTAGILEFVKPGTGDDNAQKLVKDENDDRQQLYKLLAEKEGSTPDQVAQLNARRNFDHAKPGEWLKDADGKWMQKS